MPCANVAGDADPESSAHHRLNGSASMLRRDGCDRPRCFSSSLKSRWPRGTPRSEVGTAVWLAAGMPTGRSPPPPVRSACSRSQNRWRGLLVFRAEEEPSYLRRTIHQAAHQRTIPSPPSRNVVSADSIVLPVRLCFAALSAALAARAHRSRCVTLPSAASLAGRITRAAAASARGPLLDSATWSRGVSETSVPPASLKNLRSCSCVVLLILDFRREFFSRWRTLLPVAPVSCSSFIRPNRLRMKNSSTSFGSRR